MDFERPITQGENQAKSTHYRRCDAVAGECFEIEMEAGLIPVQALLEKSPLGKIPYIETDEGVLVESQVIMNYIEACHPAPALIPADPFQAAQVQQRGAACTTAGLDASMLNLGVSYTLSKRAKLFALYSNMRNGESANFSNAGTAPAPGVGQDLRQLGTGLSVSF